MRLDGQRLAQLANQGISFRKGHKKRKGNQATNCQANKQRPDSIFNEISDIIGNGNGQDGWHKTIDGRADIGDVPNGFHRDGTEISP